MALAFHTVKYLVRLIVGDLRHIHVSRRKLITVPNQDRVVIYFVYPRVQCRASAYRGGEYKYGEPLLALSEE